MVSISLMTFKNAKTILFASLLVAMILPFSTMNFVDAAPNENASDKAKEIGKNIIKKNKPTKVTHSEAKEIFEIHDELYRQGTNHSELKKIAMELKMKKLQQKLYDKIPKLDNKKAQKLQEKHDLFNTKVKEKIISDKMGLTKFRSELPFVRMSVDESNGALKFGFLEKDLEDDDKIESYLEQIREIVGDKIDVKIYLTEKPKTGSCSSRTSDCTPIVGGIKMSTWTEAGTVGFQAKRLEGTTWKEGFITAGHNANGTGLEQTVYQALNRVVGTLELESFKSNTYCDCAWVETTTSVDDSIYGGVHLNSVATPTVNTAVTAIGYKSGTLTGIITDTSDNIWVEDEQEGDVYLRGQLVVDFVMQDGDSGGVVYKNSGSELVGIMSSYDSTQTWVSNAQKLSSLSSSVKWDFD